MHYASCIECKAAVRKSLQGLDYVAADGARAFEDLENLVRRLGELGLGKEARSRERVGVAVRGIA